MVADLKERHNSSVVTDIIRTIRDSGLPVAVCYPRFSDDISQMHSITDQLRKLMQ